MDDKLSMFRSHNHFQMLDFLSFLEWIRLCTSNLENGSCQVSASPNMRNNLEKRPVHGHETLFISLKWAKLGISDLVFRLIVA